MDKSTPSKQQKLLAYIDGINEEIGLMLKEVEFRQRNINIYYKEIMKL